MAEWIGSMVSIKCTGDLGTFQGEIAEANHTEIILIKAFCDGFPSAKPVQIRAADIVDIKFIEKTIEERQENSIITIAKPVAKRAGRSHSTSEAASTSKYIPQFLPAQVVPPRTSKPIDIELNNKFDELSISYKNNTPINNNNKRILKDGKQWNRWKDEECFGSPLEERINGDFDFEKNLALFDKQALWEELNQHQKPDLVRNVKNKKKYRHDENVIASQPAQARQITVPINQQELLLMEYVTDDGLIIPCISRNLRKKLLETAEKLGLTFEKRVELFGIAAAEISIQLLGGGHRLNPNNMHQLPLVVVLCGPHNQGAAGVNAARQLTSHGIKTILYCVSLDATAIKKELSLYMLTRNRTITNTQELPSNTDLIICALGGDDDDGGETPGKNLPLLAEWISKNKAPVLALDPPSCGIPGIFPKLSLLPILPLPQPSNNGQLYLANLGIPVDIFNEVGIKYRSPFGAKNTISLHPKNE